MNQPLKSNEEIASYIAEYGVDVYESAFQNILEALNTKDAECAKAVGEAVLAERARCRKLFILNTGWGESEEVSAQLFDDYASRNL
jgi:hypothetical protein